MGSGAAHQGMGSGAAPQRSLCSLWLKIGVWGCAPDVSMFSMADNFKEVI